MSAPQVIAGPQARYLVLHYSRNVRTLHVIDVDCDVTVEVFGDPDNGAYEWLIRRNGHIIEHSDCGYGQGAIALRDGLDTYYADF